MDKSTQNLLIGVGAVGLLGLIIYNIMKPAVPRAASTALPGSAASTAAEIGAVGAATGSILGGVASIEAQTTSDDTDDSGS
jgi:hypothetical protein